MDFAVGSNGSNSKVSMLTVTGKSGHWLRLERDFQTIGTEDLLDDSADKDFIISRLDSLSESPINLKLLTDVSHMAALVDLCFETSNFLVSHFNIKAILVKLNNTLLKSAANGSVRPLPILLLHNLRGRHLLNGSLLQRRLDPKLKLGGGGKANIRYITAADIQPRNVGVVVEEFKKFSLDEGEGIG